MSEQIFLLQKTVVPLPLAKATLKHSLNTGLVGANLGESKVDSEINLSDTDVFWWVNISILAENGIYFILDSDGAVPLAAVLSHIGILLTQPPVSDEANILLKSGGTALFSTSPIATARILITAIFGGLYTPP